MYFIPVQVGGFTIIVFMATSFWGKWTGKAQGIDGQVYEFSLKLYVETGV
jgi:hypothetical protein